MTTVHVESIYNYVTNLPRIPHCVKDIAPIRYVIRREIIIRNIIRGIRTCGSCASTLHVDLNSTAIRLESRKPTGH